MTPPVFFDPSEIVMVMTPFGGYRPTEFELWAFRHLYAGEAGRSDWSLKWQEELVLYADKQMEAEFLQS